MPKSGIVGDKEFDGSYSWSRHMKKKASVAKQKSTSQTKATKSCTVCGADFNNKSNLNRHMKRFHMKQKTLVPKSKSKNRTSAPQSSGIINYSILNEVLWQLLLKLVNHKTECDGANAASAEGESKNLCSL